MCENCEMMIARIKKSIQDIDEAIRLVNRYDNSIKQAMSLIGRYERLIADLIMLTCIYKSALANKNIVDLKRIIRNECPN